MGKTLQEQLYQAMTHSIEQGHLEPGLVLLEGNIAKVFGMSRSPVRQTLWRLYEEGSISRFEGRGYLVGRHPADIVRRTLTAGDFRKVGGRAAIERQDAWRQMAETVERDIVLCSMKGRLELNELQLAKTLGVSRSVTHRILLHLQSLGVVEKTKYTSWNVVPLDESRLHHLYEARLQLEPFMISQACQAMTEPEIARFIERLDDAARHYPDVPGTTLDALENDLHIEAIARGGNPEILGMLSRTRPILLVSKHLLGALFDMPAEDPFFDEHRDVFEKLLARRPEQAARSLHAHLARSEGKVQARLAAFRETAQVDLPAYLRWDDKD